MQAAPNFSTLLPEAALVREVSAESALHALTVLDDPAEWAVFSERLAPAGGLWESQLVVTGMRCAGCALNLEKALLRVAGVEAVQISAASASASVTWSALATRPSVWMGAASAAGFGLAPALDALAASGERQESRLALWRWLVAGFCMMQVMMYASPAYFAKAGEITADVLQLLRWASLVLSLPVLIFSCGPFFRHALGDLKRRSISMDLPVALGIAVTFAVSAAATVQPSGWWGGEVYFDSLCMLVFFLLTGRWLEQRLRSRTAGALGVLSQRLPVSIQRQTKDGSFERMAARRLALGDVVRVLPGEAFPADGTLTLGSTLADEALLTGESRPVVRACGAQVIAGSYNVSSAVEMRVDKLGLDTRYAHIVRLMERASMDKPRLALLADKVAKPFLLAVLVAAGGTAAFWWGTDPAKALMAAVAVLVVTCPCALSLATPAAMLTTAGALARGGVLVRRLQAIEALVDVDTVIFDKTGTLTDASVAVQSLRTRLGSDSASKAQALQIAASLAAQSLHPVSRAIVVAAGSPADLLATEVSEVLGQGLSGRSADGQWLRLGTAEFCGVDVALDHQKHVYLSDALGWLATIHVDEALRPDAAPAVATFKRMGLKVVMLSGDTLEAAQRIAVQLGVDTVHAACTPQSKLAMLRALQSEGRKVLMVGNGLNDAPTLAAAHASVAVGKAVPLAQAQSDFVLPGAQLRMLPNMVLQARRTLHIIRQNLGWAVVYNSACVPLAAAGFLPAWLAGLGMALSSLLVIGNAARLNLAQRPA